MKHGYHIAEISKGKLGEISKITEELEELIDAKNQNSKVMELVELSDMMGAIEAYLEKYHSNISISDLITMSNITKRAFVNGFRK